MMKQAMDAYMNSELNDNVKIDSSLSLTNKAIEYNEQNINALNHKATLLFRKKDAKGLIEIADRLIQLRPEKPFYLGQKAIYLDLEGSSQEAKKYYEKAIDKYQDYLKKDTLNFDLMMEYVGILEASGDTLMADKTLNDMKEMDFNDYQKKILDLYKEQSVSKEQLLRYWNGEIEYDQIGEK
ncbi:MAG: hypothetical protein KDC74_07285 [Flavobacteriaceae bacterium]|nr:hypothetical protein [Flavobacteriaceae bacterium]